MKDILISHSDLFPLWDKEHLGSNVIKIPHGPSSNGVTASKPGW